ncbi:hypothetical protein UlMin_036849 [Ulmus minor]
MNPSKSGIVTCSTISRRSTPHAHPAPSHNPPPQTVNHASPPAPAQQGGGGSLLGGIGSTIAQGMAFGTGSVVAHMAMDVATATPAAPTANSFGGSDACSIHTKAFQDCLNSNGSDLSKCQFYMDMLTE